MSEFPPPTGPPVGGRPDEDRLTEWAGRQNASESRSSSTLAHDQWKLVGIGSGVGVVIGSFLPWATIVTVFGSISFEGTQGDGTITLGLGVAIIIGFVTGLTWLRWLAGLAALGIGVLDWINVSRAVGDADTEYTNASTGYGLYIVVAGAVLALVATRFMDKTPR